MSTVYDPFATAEFAVEILDGETLIGRTEPTRDPSYAAQALRKLSYAYPGSRIAWRSHPRNEWTALDEAGLDRMAYQRTASVVAFLIGEGLAKVNWSLSSTRPNDINGHLVGNEDPREALKAYADLLGGEVTDSPHLNGKVQIKAAGAYHGLSVEVWDLITPEQSADQAEAVSV
ncbi:hypothetical protein ETD86_37125 [Nonomuraea turkmeniaca]|uniref:Uncharacterized protein n=1 Tax=Nonomuraea turkmeniaca TaxID=103838 RepID=A0A5S4F501_9ACTN|nr:hypothetical protein [Nonomuraea turkmeniaca]TMR11069.1 hypothetical protein ETD86_37125 [Nonomuraea turkmeniaca]